MANINIAPEYGYVILVAFASYFVNMWLAIKVAGARKKFKVTYPTLYSPTNDEFNCYQRAHQNFLEMYPPFLVFLFVGGVLYPKLCAAGGVIWLLGRIVYAIGYYTGNPASRNRGAFHYLGFLILLGCNFRFAAKLLGWY